MHGCRFKPGAILIRQHNNPGLAAAADTKRVSGQRLVHTIGPVQVQATVHTLGCDIVSLPRHNVPSSTSGVTRLRKAATAEFPCMHVEISNLRLRPAC